MLINGKEIDFTQSTIDLSGQNINDDIVKFLAEELENNKFVTELNLSNNQITNIGAQHIAKMLIVNDTLTSLNLDKNQISAVGGTEIANALKINRNILYINLSNNALHTEGLNNLFAALEENKSVVTLILNNNDIHFSSVDNLAKMLKNNTSLQHIYLANNNLSNIATTILANALQDNKTINTLSLYNNNIGYEGVTALMKMLDKNKIIKHLNLSDNNIGSHFKAQMFIAKAIRGNKSLSLYLPNISNSCIVVTEKKCIPVMGRLFIGEDLEELNTAKQLGWAIESNTNIIYFNKNKTPNYKKIELIADKLIESNFDNLPYGFLKTLDQNKSAIEHILSVDKKQSRDQIAQLFQRAQDSEVNTKWTDFICKKESFKNASPFPRDIWRNISSFIREDYIDAPSIANTKENFLEHIISQDISNGEIIKFYEQHEKMISRETLKTAKEYANHTKNKALLKLMNKELGKSSKCMIM